MLDVFYYLDKMGITSRDRPIHLYISDSDLNKQIYIYRIEGFHEINKGFEAEILCLSTNPFIELKSFINCRVAIDQATDSMTFTRHTGIVVGASLGQSDGAFTLYKLNIVDPLYLWKHRINSRVFMDKSVIDVISIIFDEWRYKSFIFMDSIKLSLKGIQYDKYDKRPFMMQYQETDYDFCTRILREEGINFLIDESSNIVPTWSQTPEPQILRLIDHIKYFTELNRGSIRYHRSNATEKTDTIISFIAERNLKSTEMQIQRWDANAFDQEKSEYNETKHKYSPRQISLEQSFVLSPAWIRDIQEKDSATTSSNKQMNKMSENLLAYQDLISKKFIAVGSVRDAHVGYYFSFYEHPEIEKNHQNDNEFLILSKRFYNQNNFPKDFTNELKTMFKNNHWFNQDELSEERIGCRMELVRRDVRIVPEYNPIKDRPVVHLMRGRVVGPKGNTIYTDEWSRVKVQFLFSRSDDNKHSFNAGSSTTHTDSAWLDILTPWAYADGGGASFIPRIGEIVVIAFFNGDVDRPFVTGRLHEGKHKPVQFDKIGKLPINNYLSGFRSNEIGGNDYGQLRFNDFSQKVSAQLQSSYASSQINLGHLTHPSESDDLKSRGEGFEIRTDKWGAMRAGAGLLISTYKQDKAAGDHMAADAAKKIIETSYQNSKALSQIAKNQNAYELSSIDQLKAFGENIQKDIAKFNQAMMLLTSPDGITLSTPKELNLTASKQINQVAGAGINLSTEKGLIGHAKENISLFACKSGVQMFSAKGNVDVQAQSDNINMIARKNINITSTEGEIRLKAKHIIIETEGSQVELKNLGIFHTTTGPFLVKSGQHQFKPAERVNTVFPVLPFAEVNQLCPFELLAASGSDDFEKNENDDQQTDTETNASIGENENAE